MIAFGSDARPVHITLHRPLAVAMKCGVGTFDDWDSVL